jgi:hypothetical protein
MTAKEHGRLVGIFLMVHACMQSFGVLIVGLVFGVLIAASLNDSSNELSAELVGLFIFILFSIILILLQLLGGWKLLKDKTNARTWAIVGSIVSLLTFPFGTAAGIYGLWFLFGDVGKNYYLQNDMNRNFIQPPPPPNNWK